eukprot:TRINITY_DN12956_c0_g1_i7.p3 TRINITY_DN12956_c0_g1~~TRINITY_DN12956_c0_g1_i7.p3  ORF type:complete len:207 (+),score=51.02 TRINITY_DN12956_c0_g1_i7:84-623(+)
MCIRDRRWYDKMVLFYETYSDSDEKLHNQTTSSGNESAVVKSRHVFGSLFLQQEHFEHAMAFFPRYVKTSRFWITSNGGRQVVEYVIMNEVGLKISNMDELSSAYVRFVAKNHFGEAALEYRRRTGEPDFEIPAFVWMLFVIGALSFAALLIVGYWKVCKSPKRTSRQRRSNELERMLN